MPNDSLDAAYFERVYAGASDPWSFATSPYEAQKYEQTLASLGERRFTRALEIGCSIGVFTERLAGRCDELVAVDINERALAEARKRCAQRPNVTFAHMVLPHDFPDGTFDLIVLSEVGYYWSDDDLALARDRFVRAAPGGTIELVHFLPDVSDYVRPGDAVHEIFLADDRFECVRSHRDESYRIEVLTVR